MEGLRAEIETIVEEADIYGFIASGRVEMITDFANPSARDRYGEAARRAGLRIISSCMPGFSIWLNCLGFQHHPESRY